MNVEVRCICPVRTEHRDTVTLRDKLEFRGAMACKQAVRALRLQDPQSSDGDFLAVLTEHYIIHGIEAWTAQERVDGKMQPVPVVAVNIRRLLLDGWTMTDDDPAVVLAEAAEDLYTEAVLLPLLGLASNSSPPTPEAAESTSATIGPEPTPLKRSKRSSTSTTPTDDIGATSPSLDGVSSSSQSSTTAA